MQVVDVMRYILLTKTTLCRQLLLLCLCSLCICRSLSAGTPELKRKLVTLPPLPAVTSFHGALSGPHESPPPPYFAEQYVLRQDTKPASVSLPPLSATSDQGIKKTKSKTLQFKKNNSLEHMLPDTETSRKKKVRKGKVRKNLRSLRRGKKKQPASYSLPAAQFSEKGIALSDDGQWIAIAWASRRAVSIHRIHNPSDYYLINYTGMLSKPIHYISRIELSPENNAISLIFGTTGAHTLGIFDIETGQLSIPAPKLEALSAHSDSGHFSPDGRLITAHAPKTAELMVIDWRTREIVQRVDTSDTQYTSVCFEDNDTLLFTTYQHIYRMSILTGKYKSHWYFPRESTTDVVLKADCLKQATFSSGGTAVIAEKGFASRVYSAATGRLRFVMRHRGQPEIVTSRDDQTIFMGRSHSIAGYSLDTGKQTFNFGPVSNRVNALKLSPDGKSLLAGTMDGQVSLWDIESQQPLLKLNRPDKHNIGNVWFTSDGEHLICSGYNAGEVLVWKLYQLGGRLNATLKSLQDFAFDILEKIEPRFAPAPERSMAALTEQTARLALSVAAAAAGAGTKKEEHLGAPPLTPLPALARHSRQGLRSPVYIHKPVF